MSSSSSAKVAAVFVKPLKGEAVVPAQRLECEAGFGIAGDANAAAESERQVLLVSQEVEADLGLMPGALWENVTTTGIDVDSLPAGTLVHLGDDAVIEVTGPCNPCRTISAATGLRIASLKGRRGILGLVIAPGSVAPGDAIEIEI